MALDDIWIDGDDIDGDGMDNGGSFEVTAAVPEPALAALMLAGGLAVCRKRRAA